MAEGIAVEGMRLVFINLPKAVADGTDIEARANMMAAAAMGATAFQKGLGVVHSLSHPVGALYNTHHGMTNGVFMPYVLAFNRPAIEDKIARLAAWLGIAGGFDGFQATLLDLRKRTGVPAHPQGPRRRRFPLRRDGGDGGRRPEHRRQPGAVRRRGGQAPLPRRLRRRPRGV